MKKVAFLIVSAVLASVSFCSNAAERVVNQFAESTQQINLNFSLSCTQKSQISENKPQKYCTYQYL